MGANNLREHSEHSRIPNDHPSKVSLMKPPHLQLRQPAGKEVASSVCPTKNDMSAAGNKPHVL